MIGQSGSILPQGCPEYYFPEPHTHSCVHCHHLCDPIYDTPLECEKFCPDYNPLKNPATSRQDDQTTSLLGMKHTSDTEVVTTSAILTIAVSFLLVNMIYFRTKRNSKSDDKRELEKLFPKHSVHQTKYHMLRELRMISIQYNASDGHYVCLKNSRNIRSTNADMETVSLTFNLVNVENVPHEHTAVVHHQQNNISNMNNKQSDKRPQHQTDLSSINTKNIHSDVERNNNLESQADYVSTPHEVAMGHIHYIQDQSPEIRPWFFYKAHYNEIQRSATHQLSPASTASEMGTQGLANERTYPMLHKSYHGEAIEPMSNHKNQGDLKKYIYENNGESTYDLSLQNVNSSWRPLHPDMQSIDKNSGDEELSHFLPQDTLAKTRLQDQCEDEELSHLLPQDIQYNIRIKNKSDSSGYGTQDTDNSSPSCGTMLQCFRVSSALSDVGSFRCDVNRSLHSDFEQGAYSTMLPNGQTEIYLQSDSGGEDSHGKTYIDIDGSDTWGKVRLLYAKIQDLMPKMLC